MQYLFLAIPNFCGSTLVHNLISTCPDVVKLTSTYKDEKHFKDLIEGQTVCPDGYKNLNGPHSIEANMEHVYADPKNYNWKLIKDTWDKNWAANNPNATIRLQKTPGDIFRIKTISEYFPKTKWIISVRNPYAYVESIIRKSHARLNFVRQIDQICYHVTRVMELQLENAKFLGKNGYVMTYEDFCARPELHREKLGEWITELKTIDFNKKFWVKNLEYTKIDDDSEQRIQNMINGIPGILEQVNKYFIPLEPLLNKWGYEIRNAT